MNRNELIEYHSDLCDAARELMRIKNHDYAGEGSANPWMNFERSELMGVCKTEQAFMVRILDKISRLITFVDAGQLQVKEESVFDSIVDLINYLVLFGAFVSDKNEKESPEEDLVQGKAGYLTEEDIDDIKNK